MKHNKFFTRNTWIQIISIQLLILIFAVRGIQESLPIDIENCHELEFVVERVEYKRIYRENRFSVFFNDIEYRFPEVGITKGNPSSQELSKLIKENDNIRIVYLQKKGILGYENLIVDAQKDGEIIFSYDNYYATKEKGFVGMIVCISVIEVLFMAGISFHIVLKIKKYT